MSSTWEFVFGRFQIYLFNTFLMWLMLIFIWGILGSPIAATGVSWVLISILTYIHINKYYSRQTPLLPEDFQLASQATTLTKFVDYGSITRLVIACLLMIFLTALFYRFWAKKLHLKRTWKTHSFAQKHAIAMRLLIVTVAGGAFFFCTDFIRHHDGSRYEDVPFLNTTFTAWNQNRNYTENGFIVGFLYNFQKLQREEPDVYS